MMKKYILIAAAGCSAITFGMIGKLAEETEGKWPRSFELSADRIAVDNVTKASIATGHVKAVSLPLTITGDYATRDATGLTCFADGTSLTTCTNHPHGVCHWSLKGQVEYRNADFISGRNLWLEFYEIPVFWIPYFYYPLNTEYGLRFMVGYTSRWGAFMMSKYVYHIAGDPAHGEGTTWLRGNTRFDLRKENGAAFGQSLRWGLGELGQGRFKVYYAHDEDYDRYERHWNNRNKWNYSNWGSDVDRERYATELEHRWEPTERDIVRLKGSIFSDSYFRHDFFRTSTMTIANDWLAHYGNEIAWEHNENTYAFGASVSGPLNDFYTGISRLPEFYFDIAPQPLWNLPLNYESQSRIGYLSRDYAKYGEGKRESAFAFNPGPWADYSTFRFDTYHRLTAPFKVADMLAVVPRVAYRGTYWNDSGNTVLDGWGRAGKDNGQMFRSVIEGGVTFAARGQSQISEKWRHMIEPYFDVLAQEAYYSGRENGNRPYWFDSLDGSRSWEDQFAGRSRNLPYSYYGVTPGLRNVLITTDEKGASRTVLDFDAYVAVQCNDASWDGLDDYHRLAKPGSPNYGKNDVYATPGARVRWFPADDLILRGQAEYDPDYNKLAYAEFEFRHLVNKDFNWYASYSVRDFRMWDFSSSPYNPVQMNGENFNWIDINCFEIGFEHSPVDWFAWSPFIRWDCSENELEEVGSWFDYRTDCLGFRFIVSYEDSYYRIDRSKYDSDWNFGFFIYLRAIGADASNLFAN